MADEAAVPKKKKISRMTMAEINAELKAAQEKMGGSGSHYVQQLLKRKKAIGA